MRLYADAPPPFPPPPPLAAAAAVTAAEGGVVGTTICDAGCGTGSLSIPLALKVCLSAGRSVSAPP